MDRLEQSIVAHMMWCNNKEFEELRGMARAEWFNDLQCRAVFTAMAELADKGRDHSDLLQLVETKEVRELNLDLGFLLENFDNSKPLLDPSGRIGILHDRYDSRTLILELKMVVDSVEKRKKSIHDMKESLREKFSEIMDRMEVETPGILHIADHRDAVLDVIQGNYDHGYEIGFGPQTDRHLHLTDEGGLIVVTGRPNDGKTSFMRCLLGKLMLQKGKHVAFLSFEEPNKLMHIRRFVELGFAERRTESIPREMAVGMLDRLDSRMVDMNMDNRATTPSNIIAMCDELRRREHFRLDFLYVDPYLFLESETPKETETQQIKGILTEFQNWGRREHIWVIIVAHPRKLMKDGSTEYEEVDEYSISGSAHWANLADFLLSVKRVFPSGRGTDEGSAAPSYTQVNVLKVRDQNLCHTGKMYFLRQPNGRYEERLDAHQCEEELKAPQITYRDTEEWR